MCRQLLILFAATTLVLTQPAWGLHARAWIQDEEQRVRLERAQAVAEATKRQLADQIDEALQQGDGERAAGLNENLAKLDAQMREFEARFERSREESADSRPQDKHPESTSGPAQDDKKVLRLERAMAEASEERRELAMQLKDAEKTRDESKIAELHKRAEQNGHRLHDLYVLLQNVRNERAEAHGEHPEIAAARDQVKHLRAAHGHLMEGGFKDMAEKVAQRAEEIAQAIHRHEAERGEQAARERDARSRAPAPDQLEGMVKELGGAIRQLREDVNKLREELAELRDKGEK